MRNGDAGFLKRIKTELRRFNTMGDTTWCKGKVLKKYVEDGYALRDTHHDLHVVLDQQDRKRPVPAKLGDEVDERRGFLRVHAGRRLVEQEQLGLGR